MKKIFYTLALSTAAIIQSYAQNVGIGTNTPNTSAKLDVTSTTSGVLIPRVALTMTTVGAPVAAPANSLLVYNTATAGDVTPGFYYWNSTTSAWTRIAEGKAGWEITGNNGITAANFLGTINNADLIIRTNNTEKMRILANGRVGINTTTPGALLDVNGGTWLRGLGTTAADQTFVMSNPGIAGSGGLIHTQINANTPGTLGFKEYTANTGVPANARLIWSTVDMSTPNTLTTNHMLVLHSQNNVGINVPSADPSSQLEIASTTRGLLIPRVALSATNVAAPITAPVTSLMVYNTATAGAGTTAVTPGHYYWDGTQWLRYAVGKAGWDLLGNAGTNPATNYLGTSDAQDLVFRTNATERMRIKSGGAANIWSGTNFAVPNNYMAGGSLTIGNIGANFGGGGGWNANTAGLMLECLDNTEIGVHDSGTRLTSLSYFEGAGTNRIQIGRDMGWGPISIISMHGNVGIGTLTPGHRLDVVGGGGATIDLRTTGRIWTNSTDGGMWLSNLQDGFMGNINANQMGFWSSTVGWNALNITKSNGYVGIGTTAPTARLHVISDGDNIPVIYGVNTNATAATTSFGVRGECGSTGLGSAGVSGVSTNSSQNEIGVVGDYSLWGAALFGLAWASAYTDMPASRDFGVFATCNFSTGTGVYARDMNGAAGSYAFYGTGKFSVTGAKAASVPTTKGNQLVYCTESPEIWFEDLGTAKLQNGSVHIKLDDMFYETVFISEEHPMHVFMQEQGDCNGLYFIPDADGKGFTVKEKQNGTSNTTFSYRIMAKRRFYQEHRFGVDSNQPFGDNLSNAKNVDPITTDPQEMERWVNEQTRMKEAAAGYNKKENK